LLTSPIVDFGAKAYASRGIYMALRQRFIAVVRRSKSRPISKNPALPKARKGCQARAFSGKAPDALL
jgi:hypothetical protein